MYAETHAEGSVKTETDHNRNKDRREEMRGRRREDGIDWEKGKSQIKINLCFPSSRSVVDYLVLVF